VENVLKIVKRAGLFNRDLRVMAEFYEKNFLKTRKWSSKMGKKYTSQGL
jgi:hypothetical protein